MREVPPGYRKTANSRFTEKNTQHTGKTPRLIGNTPRGTGKTAKGITGKHPGCRKKHLSLPENTHGYREKHVGVPDKHSGVPKKNVKRRSGLASVPVPCASVPLCQWHRGPWSSVPGKHPAWSPLRPHKTPQAATAVIRLLEITDEPAMVIVCPFVVYLYLAEGRKQHLAAYIQGCWCFHTFRQRGHSKIKFCRIMTKVVALPATKVVNFDKTRWQNW